MTGRRYNNQYRSGQVLLIAIMLIATILTVVMATVFRAQTDTRTAKLEQDSQTALAGAEAALEAALRSKGSVTIGSGDLSTISGLSGTASYATTQDTQFVTPLLQKDEQYTFYLAPYDGTTHTLNTASAWSPNSNQKQMTIYFESEAGQQPVVELSFQTANGGVIRYMIDPHNLISKNATNGNVITATTTTTKVKGISFGYQSGLVTPYSDVNTNSVLMFIRVLNGSTRIGVTSGVNLPVQGQTIVSSATTSDTQVKKTINLFQSYPQIPAGFYVTSF